MHRISCAHTKVQVHWQTGYTIQTEDNAITNSLAGLIDYRHSRKVLARNRPHLTFSRIFKMFLQFES